MPPPFPHRSSGDSSPGDGSPEPRQAPPEVSSPRPDLLVWIDLEMTGLEPERCHILEIATLITNNALEVIAEGPCHVIHADEAALATLSDWSREQFTRSGLLDRCRASQVALADAEAETLAFVQRYCTERTAPLCGNSIHTDRAFLYQGMRQLHDWLHYRNVDVSSFKEMLRRWHGEAFKSPAKRGLHEALADIRESIDELRFYRDRYIVLPDPAGGSES